MQLPASNSLKVLESCRRISPKVFNNVLLCIQFIEAQSKFLQSNIYENRYLYRNPHQDILLPIISHQPAKVWGEGSWLVNLWKGLKAESKLKFKLFFFLIM